MDVLYVSFGSRVRPRTFGCIAMGNALLLVYYAVSGMNNNNVYLKSNIQTSSMDKNKNKDIHIIN